MSGGLDDLAGRMRAAVEEQERKVRLEAEAAARLEAERARMAAEATAARDAVLDDLEAFGRALGLVAVERTRNPHAVRFDRDSKNLGFVADESDQLRVSGGPVGVLVARDPAAGWEVVWPGAPPVRRPLEAGIEELLVTVLGFPRALPAAPKTASKAKAKAPVHTMVVDTSAATQRRGAGAAPLVGGSIREFKGPLEK